MKKIALIQRVDNITNRSEKRDSVDQKWTEFLMLINIFPIYIPNNIKYAQYELARALANDTDAITGTTGKDGNFSEVKLGDIQVKYNTDSQGTGSVNNILDVYPWLQSYLGAYMLGGAGSFQMRVVRG